MSPRLSAILGYHICQVTYFQAVGSCPVAGKTTVFAGAPRGENLSHIFSYSKWETSFNKVSAVPWGKISIMLREANPMRIFRQWSNLRPSK